MTGPTNKRRKGARAVDPVTLFRRRVALGVHLALEACVLVGSQGPWWDVLIGGEAVARHAGYDAARATGPMEPMAALAALAALVAFFFASYDLVADADLQAPVLAASVVACVAAGAVAHRVLVAEDDLNRIAEEVMRADVEGALDRPPPAETAPVATSAPAPVTSGSDDPLARLRTSFSLRPAWGMALMVAAAPLMVAVSVFLTFFAAAPRESS